MYYSKYEQVADLFIAITIFLQFAITFLIILNVLYTFFDG